MLITDFMCSCFAGFSVKPDFVLGFTFHIFLPSTVHTGAFQELEIAGKNQTKSDQNLSKEPIFPPRRQETHNLRTTHTSCFLCCREVDRREAADVTVSMFTCHILVGAKVHVVPGRKRSSLSCR